MKDTETTNTILADLADDLSHMSDLLVLVDMAADQLPADKGKAMIAGITAINSALSDAQGRLICLRTMDAS